MVVLEIILSIFVRNINKACPFHPLICLHFMRNEGCTQMKDQMLQKRYTKYLSSSERDIAPGHGLVVVGAICTKPSEEFGIVFDSHIHAL